MERKKLLLGAASLDKGNMQEMTKKDGPSGIFSFLLLPTRNSRFDHT